MATSTWNDEFLTYTSINKSFKTTWPTKAICPSGGQSKGYRKQQVSSPFLPSGTFFKPSEAGPQPHSCSSDLSGALDLVLVFFFFFSVSLTNLYFSFSHSNCKTIPLRHPVSSNIVMLKRSSVTQPGEVNVLQLFREPGMCCGSCRHLVTTATRHTVLFLLNPKVGYRLQCKDLKDIQDVFIQRLYLHKIIFCTLIFLCWCFQGGWQGVYTVIGDWDRSFSRGAVKRYRVYRPLCVCQQMVSRPS